MFELQKHQRILRGLSDELLMLLGCDQPGEWEKLSRARWNLVGAYAHHVAIESRLVYRVLERDPRPDVPSIARRFARSREAHIARLEEHMTYWTRARIEQQWHAFTSDARRLVTSCVAWMDRSEHELYPLLRRPKVRVLQPMRSAGAAA